MDGDRNPPQDAANMLEKAQNEGFDVVYAVRSSRKERF